MEDDKKGGMGKGPLYLSTGTSTHCWKDGDNWVREDLRRSRAFQSPAPDVKAKPLVGSGLCSSRDNP